MHNQLMMRAEEAAGVASFDSYLFIIIIISVQNRCEQEEFQVLC